MSYKEFPVSSLDMRLIYHLFGAGSGRFPATAIRSGVKSTPAFVLEGLPDVASNPIAPNRARSCNGDVVDFGDMSARSR